MQATLAAVIITAVIFSVEHHVVKPVWNSKREKYFALSRYIFAKEYIINIELELIVSDTNRAF